LSSFAGDIKLVDLETGCSPKKCAFTLGFAFIPCIFMPARLIYIRNNPRIEIDREYSVPGTLCQKCRNGKIKHGFIIDGQCVREVKDLYICIQCKIVYPEYGFIIDGQCVREVKDLYICIQCKIVYPEYNLSKYIGNKSPYSPYRGQLRRD